MWGIVAYRAAEVERTSFAIAVARIGLFTVSLGYGGFESVIPVVSLMHFRLLYSLASHLQGGWIPWQQREPDWVPAAFNQPRGFHAKRCLNLSRL